ncbi:MAG: hypothetical protein AUJ98_00925 [Bacteroidetes bacterium CG2_30_33_31]|nr:MAG: hypothetical protein AUJ98_00925 [Bacteroidetes bacterium CG2_30_33_31]
MSFRVYKSSAGSGKTTTLVMEYLQLAIMNPEIFNSIVGITFTIKATNEMKSRVMDTLSKIALSEGKFDQVINTIFLNINKVKATSEDEFIANSKKLLQNILHNYSNFAFSTIDSFVVNIVKSFAYDLGLPMDFEIELDKELIIEEAVASLISKAGYDEDLTLHLIHHIENQLDATSDTRLDVVIGNLAQLLFKDSFSNFKKVIGTLGKGEIKDFSNKIIKDFKKLELEISDIGTAATKLIQSKNINSSHFFYGNKGIAKYFENLENLSDNNIIPNSYVVKTIEEDNWFSNKCSLDSELSILEIKHQLIDYYNIVISKATKYLDLYVIRKSIESVALLNEVAIEIQNFYQENSVIHLSETVERISNIVLKEQMPFIYERIGNVNRHYLIDEFQDTSVIQWQSLLPLIENSLSFGYLNLIVGDAKQSIYRWRGGDFEQFVDLPIIKGSHQNSILKERQDILNRNYEEKFLNRNYRSCLSVVKFNNDFYEYIKSKNYTDIISKVYDNHHQEPFSNKKGYVEISISPEQGADKLTTLKKINSIISDLLFRNFNYQDIAILARKNANLLLVADSLLENSIPVISSQSLLLKSSLHICFIINFISWLNKFDDKVSKTAVIFYLIEQDIILQNEFDKYFDCKTPADLLGLIAKSKEKSTNFSVLNSSDINVIIEYVATFFDIYAIEMPFVIHLLNMCRKAEDKNGVGLSNFLDYWNLKKDNEFISIPEGINAVNLLTIHKSKGLEFPIVIYVEFASKDYNNDFLEVSLQPLGFDNPPVTVVRDSKILLNTSFKEDKQMSMDLALTDSINLLYVATTRAKNELYILDEEKSKHSKDFLEFVTTNKDFIKGSDENEYYVGTKDIANIDYNKDLEISEVLNFTEFVPWNERIFLRNINSEGSTNTESCKKIFDGLKIHNLLSKIKSANNIIEVIDNQIKKGHLIESERNNFLQQLENIVNDKSVAEYFSTKWEVINERKLITNKKNFRPDRVLINEQEVVVIDYKLSHFSEASDSQKNKYRNQLIDYMDILKVIYTDKKVSGKILWLKTPLILEEI